LFKTHRILPFVLCLLICTQFVTAAAVELPSKSQFCFSSADFTEETTDEGIFVTAVPSPNIASICYGNRVLKAGDALTKEMLDDLTLETACVTSQVAIMEYCTVSNGKITGVKSLKMSISPQKNDPPTAKSSTFETYRNIENSGKLTASDPEGSSLTYRIVDNPKRGTITLASDGTFTYTPTHNKVGSDSFTFTATDTAGNTSNIAKVTVTIKKPTDKKIYADMTDDPDQFVAMWMKEKDIYSGSNIGGNFCFCPEQTVSRGEFLVMVMNLVGADNDLAATASGFADENNSPKWIRPYITAALSNGMITGTATESGPVFRPNDTLEKAEAAVMLQNILSLPTAVFSQEDNSAAPVWAADSINALSQAGLELEFSSATDPLTRREAARLLYDTNLLIQSDDSITFHWQQ